MSSLESHGKLAPLSLQEDYTGLLILRSLKHGDARDAACSWLHRIGPDRRSRGSTARLIYRNGSRVWCVFAPFCNKVGSNRQFLQGPWSGLPKFGVIDVRILWGVKHYYYIRQRWQICRKNRRSVLVVLNASVWNCDRFTPISMHLNAFRHLESRVQHQKGVAQKILIVRLLGWPGYCTFQRESLAAKHVLFISIWVWTQCRNFLLTCWSLLLLRIQVEKLDPFLQKDPVDTGWTYPADTRSNSFLNITCSTRNGRNMKGLRAFTSCRSNACTSEILLGDPEPNIVSVRYMWTEMFFWICC